MEYKLIGGEKIYKSSEVKTELLNLAGVRSKIKIELNEILDQNLHDKKFQELKNINLQINNVRDLKTELDLCLNCTKNCIK